LQSIFHLLLLLLKCPVDVKHVVLFSIDQLI
jgi:hypothetical protein